MYKKLIIILLLILPFEIIAKEALLTNHDMKVLIPSESRITSSLSGEWDVSYDNEATWQKIDVPHSTYSEDRAIFKRTVKIDKELINSKTWQLFFLGVNNDVDVYFNDLLLGRYYGYSSPFFVNIPSRCISGEENTIKVIAYQSEYNFGQARMLAPYVQKNYVGILRDILLIGTESIWIEKVTPKSEVNSTYTTSVVDLTMSISSDNIVNLQRSQEQKKRSTPIDTNTLAPIVTPAASMKDIAGLYVKVRIIDPVNFDTTRYYRSENFVLESERSTDIKMSLRIDNPILWSIEDPHLYKFQVELYKDGNLIDDYILSYGIKDFKTQNSAFYLNKKEILIKGIEYFEDYYHTDFSISSKRVRKDLKLIKLLGANTIFISNNAPHPLLTSLCDSLGLMINVPLPGSSIPNKKLLLDEIKVASANIIDQIINYYEKHTSVIGYRVSDRLDEASPIALAYNNAIIKQIKDKTDKYVFKTILINSKSVADNNVDFIVLHNGMPHTDFHKLDAKVKGLKSDLKGKPIVFLFGTIFEPNNYNGYADFRSVNYQAYNYSQCYKIADNNNLAGVAIRSFNDYVLQNPELMTDYYDRDLSSTGIFSRNRKFRTSFNLIQALFTDKTEPLLDAGSLNPNSLVPVLYMVLTLIMVAILFLMISRMPRFREYFVRSLVKPYNFYADIRDQRIISSVHTYSLAIMISLSAAIFIVSIVHINRSSEVLYAILNSAISSNSIKDYLYDLIWQPKLFMFLLSGVFFVKLLIVAFLLKVLAKIFRANVYYGDTITMAVWAANPLILLLILNLFHQRIVAANPEASIVFLIILALLIVLFIIRLMRSVAVVFDKNPILVYVVGLLFILLIAAIPFLYYSLSYNIFSYIQHAIQVL